MTSLTRRQAAASLAAACILGWVAPARAQGSINGRTLKAVVDTILPADALTPAASALGVDRDIAQIAEDHALIGQLVSLGLGWLDEISGGDFAAQSEAARLDLLRFAMAQDYNQIPGRFSALLRELTMQLYYDQTDGYADLPLNPTPQPMGYPPPWG